MSRALLALLLSACFMFGPERTLAQSYPTKPVRIVVPYGTGGGPDILARLFAQKLQDGFGQSFLVENRPGASGNLGTEQVAKAPPDGYTLLATTTANVAINPSLYPGMGFDPLKDLTPLGMVAITPIMLVVANDLPARNLRELINHAKARPGKLSFASAGSGTMQHIAAELLKSAAGVDLVHVPYKGSGQIMPDLIAGRVSLMFNSFAAVLPMVKDGKLRAIGVASLGRSPSAPDIPTLAEAGLPGFEADAWYGFHAPAGLPRALVSRLSAALANAVDQPDVKARLVQLGMDPAAASPEQLDSRARADRDKWAKVIKDNNIRAD
jgi:tripartite-type tricarboxylate transporter receptor subunit TctC